MNILLVWLGKMGQFHLQNLLQIPTVDRIYAFDIFENTFKIKNDKIIYSTVLEDFDNIDIDFVDIVSPTKFHFSYLERYIKQNKNIFIEKPFVSNIEEMNAIEHLVNTTNYSWKIGIWFIERYNVVSKFLKETIKKRWDPKQVEIFRYNPWSNRIADSDVTTDLMIHDLDLLNYFFRWEPLSVVGKNISIDSSTVLLKVKDTSITLSSNRITQQKIRQIKFFYDDVTIVGDFMLAKLDFYHKPSEYLSEKGQDLSITYLLEERILMKNNQLKDELEEFCEITQGWSYKILSNYLDGKKSIAILNILNQ